MHPIARRKCSFCVRCDRAHFILAPWYVPLDEGEWCSLLSRGRRAGDEGAVRSAPPPVFGRASILRHAGGPRRSDDAHHRPQRSASVPGNRNRRCKVGLWASENAVHGDPYFPDLKSPSKKRGRTRKNSWRLCSTTESAARCLAWMRHVSPPSLRLGDASSPVRFDRLF